MAGKKPIPDAYGGREQALIKHKLLENYLQKLFFIIGSSAGVGGRIELCYVDCFAGPWGDDSEAMESTSPAVSLHTLDICRQRLGINGSRVKIRALYVEKDARAFARLSAYLQSSAPKGIQSECRHGDFVALREEVLQWAGKDAFVFFFIDPKGWKEVGIEMLRPLLQRPRSEFLITFMYDFVNRTLSMSEWQTEMAQLLGEPIKLDGKTPEQRELAILKTYRTNLKCCVTATHPEYPPRSAYVRVMDRTRERPKYHMVYVTSHPRGIIEFMEISDKLDFVQKQVRAIMKHAEREQRTGTPDLFSADTLVNPNAGHASPEDVDRFWLNYLATGTRRIDRKAFAKILEDTDWFPGDLQGALVRLIDTGAVRNLDAIKRRPKKPLHFDAQEGERLQRLEK